MGILERFYKALQIGESLMNLNLPHRDILYIKAHLESKFQREFTVEQVKKLLKLEGLEYRR